LYEIGADSVPATKKGEPEAKVELTEMQR